MILLIPGTVYTEPNRNDRPFKICPDIVEAKDTPCRVLTPSASLAQRMEIPNTNKINSQKITELEYQIKSLQEENKILQEKLEKQQHKIDLDKPSNTRSIRG